MRFSVSLPDFQKLLQNVIQAVPPKSTLPVLENFHFRLEGSQLQATATDQELTVISSVAVQGNDDGTILVPARKLFDIVKALGNAGMLTFASEPSTFKITLKTDYGEYTMFGMDPQEFPDVPDFATGVTAKFSKDDIMKIAQKTVFAVSRDEYRPAMTGVLFQFDVQSLNAVSTDSYRLVRVTLQNNGATQLPQQSHTAIVPARALDLLKKVDSDVDVLMSDTHAKFALDGMTIITRLIDERFPAYENVIPTNNDKEVKFMPGDVLASVKRVALFSSSISRQVQFALEPNKWTIVGEDLETGNKAVEAIPCEYANEPIEIGFNYRYIEEALNHLVDGSSSEVLMSFSTPTRPALMKPTKDGAERDDVLMLIMPVRPLQR